jgi:hypothetical protein
MTSQAISAISERNENQSFAEQSANARSAYPLRL